MQLPVQLIKHGTGPRHTRVLSFLDQELRRNAGFSIEDEFPSVFGEFPGGDSFVIERSGRIAAHVGLVAREYQHAEFRLKVGLIGSVVTSVEWQGYGLGSQLVRLALQELRARGCAIAVLWTDSPDFYRELGFERAGREIDYQFDPAALPKSDGPRAIPMDLQRHGHLIWRLYLKHTGRLDRSLEEQKLLLKIPKCKVFVTENAGGISSYIAIEKGADFANYIHEWGGDAVAVRDNIASVQREFFPEQPLTLIAPAFVDQSPIAALAAKQWDGVLGMMRLLDRQRLQSVYTAFLRGRGVQRAPVWPASDSDYLALVFTGDAAALPGLPFFLWGFDSI